MKQTNQERIQQLQQEIVYETKARDSGVRLGLSLILILSALSLGLSFILILSTLSLGITIAEIILHPLNVGTLWDIIISLINLTTAIVCIYGLAGRDREVALFIDRIFGLNILTEKRN